MCKATFLTGILCLFVSTFNFSQTKNLTPQHFISELFSNSKSKYPPKELRLRDTEKRVREGRLNKHNLNNPSLQKTAISLNLFEDVQFEVVLQKEKGRYYKNLQVWKGRTADDRFNHLPHYLNTIIIFNPNTKKLVGIIEAAEGTFGIIPETNSQSYRIIEYKENHVQCDGGISCKHEHTPNQPLLNSFSSVAGCNVEDIDANGKTVLDIFMGFSDVAAVVAGDIDAFAAANVEMVNIGMTNSLVTDVRLRLVDTGTTPNNPGVVGSVLDDGWSWFSTEAEEAGADFIAIFQLPTGAPNEAGGIAKTGSYQSVNSVESLGTFRHEFGHNLGGDHCPGGNGILPYAYGYDNGNWKTYLCGNSEQFYSTPLVNDNLGNPIGGVNTADMARVISERKEIMTSRRSHRIPFDANDIVPCGYSIPTHIGDSEGYHITQVQVGTIDNISADSWNNTPKGYSDFSNFSTDVEINTNYTITVNTSWATSNASEGHRIGAWADWNQNLIFDADEQLIDLFGAEISNSTWIFSFTPPANASIGNTIIRIRFLYDSHTDLLSPYDGTDRFGGDSEDYTLNVTAPCTMITFFADTDGDGFGDANNTTQACTQPSGYVNNSDDCDDGNANIYPFANCDDGNTNTTNDLYNSNCQCIGTPAGCSENEIILVIQLDGYAKETSWEILDNMGITVASGGTYDDQNNQLITENICLPDGCYDFLMYDSYGDGLCCDYGNGFYNLTDASGQVLATGGDFSSSEMTNFCLNVSACNDQILNIAIQLDDYPSETTWEVTDNNGIILAAGGPYNDQYNELITQSLCLPENCYVFNIYDSVGDGICCDYGNGYYTLTNDANEIIATGGSFTDSETNNICLPYLTNVTYCGSNGNDTSFEWLEEVSLENMTNQSGNNGGYTDFSGMTLQAQPGDVISVSLTPSFGGNSYDEEFYIWIDYNHDGDFDDAGEMVFSAIGNATVTGNFTIPNNATFLPTRIRVSMKYGGSPTACESFTYGEVEDYTLLLSGNNLVEVDDRSDNTGAPLVFTHQTRTINSNLNAFPNPVSQNLTIDYQTSDDKIIALELINTVGQRVLHQTVTAKSGKNTFQINVNQLPQGTYSLKIENLVKPIVILK